MARFNGKIGYWFSTKTGSHIFVEEGKDPKQAIEEAFDITDEESGFEQEKYNILHNRYYGKNFKKRQLSHLFSPDYKDREQWGSDTYDEYATKLAEEFLNKMPKTKKGDIKESTRKANLALQNFLDKYVVKSPDGSYYWKDDKNINKRNSIYNALNKNCQRCVVAWYLQFLGYDVMARPRSPKNDWRLETEAPTSREGYERGATWELAGFIIPHNFDYDYRGTEDQTPEEQYNSISDFVNKSENGSVFFCTITRAKSGHVFIVLKDNDEVKLIEPQTNKIMDPSVFNHSKSKHTRMMRVNDLKLDGSVLPEIVQEVSKNGYRG